MTTEICLYHGVDLDGFCSGAIFADYYNNECILIPMNYGWDIPWEKLKGNNITLIDFSISPWEDFVKLAEMANKVTWIDHHKSAIEEFQGHPKIKNLSEIGKAGCELAWEYYYPGVEMPWGVHLLGRYDVWDHEDPDVLPFQYAMRLYDMRPDVGEDKCFWETILSDDSIFVENEIETGKSILKYQRQVDQIESNAKCFTIDWEDGLWICANRSGKGSTFFDSVYKSDVHTGMISFGWNGEYWTFGLYSTGDVDCGAIAKKYGGGGHKGAAGFRSKTLPFDLCMSQRYSSAQSD